MIDKRGLGLFCYPYREFTESEQDRDAYQRGLKDVEIFCFSEDNPPVMFNNAFQQLGEKKEILKLSDCYLILAQPFVQTPVAVTDYYPLKNRVERANVIAQIGIKDVLPFYFIHSNKK